VAVKTVKEGASSREKEDLLRELEIMQQLGSHANVVTLLGCCTEKGKVPAMPMRRGEAGKNYWVPVIRKGGPGPDYVTHVFIFLNSIRYN
jgi:serine/threonine protein kinase